MKKYLGFMALIAVIIFLTGCDKNITVSDVIVDNTSSLETETNKNFDPSDLGDCSSIEKTSGGLVSRDTCFRDNAIKTKNYNLCGNITNSFNKYACYTAGASDLKDIGLCGNIDDEIIRLTCEEGVDG